MDAIAMTDNHKPRSSSKLVRTDAELERTRREFIDWVDHIITQKNMTATDLAHASNLAPSTLLRILNSKTHPFNISFMTIRKVSEGSGYPIPKALIEAHDVKNVEPGEPAAKPRPTLTRGGTVKQASVGEVRTIPLRHVSSLPSSLAPTVREEVQEACPPYMLGDETAFAFRMPDDSLAPVIRGGSMMFATKRRDPTSGDILLVIDESGRALVRLVTDVDSAGIHVERLSPERKAETVSFDDVKDFGVVEGIWRR
ncbi:hypothetical protein DA075_06585 [Methylobacterium currus]|uniref:Uncharacterized protein n=1 Tax=Methylobacterium currus TaxID=2051553 RepID=A0A2R4WGG6_9HYPH|nr:S24 family peptidase [Methylobacterium currus]AWB20630.1 hypothetical protein DA075_06585 [Methylobacterium currus]